MLNNHTLTVCWKRRTIQKFRVLLLSNQLELVFMINTSKLKADVCIFHRIHSCKHHIISWQLWVSKKHLSESKERKTIYKIQKSCIWIDLLKHSYIKWCMLDDSEIAHRVLYLELLRAKMARKYVCNVHKAVNAQECGRQSDLIGWCPRRETLTQIVKAGLHHTDKENKSIYNI